MELEENKVLNIYTIVDYTNEEIATIKMTADQYDAMVWLADFLNARVSIVPYNPVVL